MEEIQPGVLHWTASTLVHARRFERVTREDSGGTLRGWPGFLSQEDGYSGHPLAVRESVTIGLGMITTGEAIERARALASRDRRTLLGIAGPPATRL